MQYQYRAITEKTGKTVSFAVATPEGTGLWHMHNFYNGDLRTENRESQLPVALAVLSLQHLPKAMSKKTEVVSIGVEQITPDLPDERELIQYLRGLIGLPQLKFEVKSLNPNLN